MKRVFLSYSFEDQHFANMIRAWLKSDPILKIDFASVQDIYHDIYAEFTRSKIITDIEAASLVVALAGDKEPSLWQEWELRKAIEFNRPIIAISVLHERKTHSALYDELSIPIVNWSYKELADALTNDGCSINYELSSKDLIQIPDISIYLETISKKLTDYLIQNPSEVQKLTPRKFEELVAYTLEKMGYEITLTSQTRDDGIDIFALKKEPIGSFLTLVECKKYSPHRPVGIDIVRSLYGVLNIQRASHAMIATTSRFTSGARAFEKEYQFQMSLRDHADIINWIKQNI